MPRLPFHLLQHSASEHRLLLAAGPVFVVLDTSTGAVVAAPAPVGERPPRSPSKAATKWIPREHFGERIRGVCWNEATSTMAVSTDSKALQLWRTSGASWELLNSRQTIKRNNCVVFSPSGSDVIVGDKFGDVYRFPVADPTKRAQLLVGHVSMITDLAWSHDRKFIITADRDEKIRVSKYPNSFEIERFCLGHEQYVTRILPLPNAPGVLVSGGGDPYLILWDYTSGTILQKLQVIDTETVDIKTTAVLSIKYTSVSQSLAVIFEKQNLILIIDASQGRSLSIKQRLATSQPPLDVAFDSKGHLWIASHAGDDDALVELAVLEDGAYLAPSSSHALVRNIAHFATPTVDELPDLFEMHKLRKSSGAEHYHEQKKKQQKQRNELFDSRKRKGGAEDADGGAKGDDGAVGAGSGSGAGEAGGEQPAKKTRRSERQAAKKAGADAAQQRDAQRDDAAKAKTEADAEAE
ncbi:tRNA (guanine-N(7)-)-methyltransferase non-catalytic subunit trm82 [Polyrhizophydium stewartii]|uniref:tRNA (Guanine-N(7)-)-methyltransferase non-catalytic subunit trm82 n=1 Tax=Polyrhizophydium stewartii TaxID=2732419 RepID=A0ABR4N2V7_9FUNG